MLPPKNCQSPYTRSHFLLEWLKNLFIFTANEVSNGKNAPNSKIEDQTRMNFAAQIEDDYYVESKVFKRTSTLSKHYYQVPPVQFIEVQRQNAMSSNDQVSANK